MVLAAVLLFGSLGGIALADDNVDDSQPRVGFLERLAEKLGISTEELKGKMAEVRDEMPEQDGRKWQGRRGPAGGIGKCLEEMGVEVDMDALKAALDEAREEMKGQEDVDHRAVINGVLESFGIDVEEMKDACGNMRPAGRPNGGWMDPEAMQNRLQTLLDEGKITQEQYDKMKTRMESMPDKMPGFKKGFRMGAMRGADCSGDCVE